MGEENASDKAGGPDHAQLARAVLAGARAGTLATLLPDGAPFASLVTVGFDEEGAPLLLLSKLAVHTQNVERDSRASLLLVEPSAQPDRLAESRLSLVGRLVPAAHQEPARERFLASHPEAAGYARFGDFRIFRFQTAHGHLVAGFGRIATIPAERLHLPLPA
ncbi:HugZ family protein [Propylenella binzhouense]|uniref:CREG-like beta-barrel domain-containing protein n=1 Tax=Propylenella binzhouense TaxID=2555902 RepID=A0A964WTK8_9HYPH|nr:pyridoxamine 5'-phosphate oxidase family protein [Propylenella binzhouense]MYZ47960.1 hypothetical protein [Propylenella binzhouense]